MLSVLAFVIFRTKEEGYPLETITDASSLQRLLTVWSRDVEPGRIDTSQYRALGPVYTSHNRRI